MQEYPVIVFDGICNLCESSVKFVIRRDSKRKFKFASAQSKAGEEIQEQFGFDAIKDETVVLIKNRRAFFRSDAAIEIAKELDGYWKAISLIRIVPRPIRDFVYKGIARRRYKWFGRKDDCMLPAQDVENRFL